MKFVDEVTIQVEAGDGGDGCNSMYRDRYHRFASPDGGQGGNGANVIFEADQNIHTLLLVQKIQHRL